MELPFSRDAFLDVFAAYNTSWWVVALAFWILTVAIWASAMSGHLVSRWVFGLLAAQWGWSAVAYHAILFSRINRAAWLFAAAFVIEAGVLMWYGAGEEREVRRGRPIARIVGSCLILYGLMYPIIAVISGHAYPRVPTFGLPCPTTIVTAGFLMFVDDRVPLAVLVVPLLWSMIGASAAFTLGMHLDLALIAAAGVYAYLTWPSISRIAADER